MKPTKRREQSIPPSRKDIPGAKSEADAERRYAKAGKAAAKRARTYRSPHAPKGGK